MGVISLLIRSVFTQETVKSYHILSLGAYDSFLSGMVGNICPYKELCGVWCIAKNEREVEMKCLLQILECVFQTSLQQHAGNKRFSFGKDTLSFLTERLFVA